jgi:hypothetical protein
MWAFLSGLLVLAGAHVSATRYTLRLARKVKMEERRVTLEEQTKKNNADR